MTLGSWDGERGSEAVSGTSSVPLRWRDAERVHQSLALSNLGSGCWDFDGPIVVLAWDSEIVIVLRGAMADDLLEVVGVGESSCGLRSHGWRTRGKFAVVESWHLELIANVEGRYVVSMI